MTSAPPRYEEWLDCVFNPYLIPTGWLGLPEYEDFEATGVELAELVAYTLENCGRDLAGYSDKQVRSGLEYIFNNSCSDTSCVLKRDEVPLPLKLRVIASIKALYRDCFTPRCAPVLSHIDEPGANILNSTCFMLWDVTPLAYWEGLPDKEVYYDAIVDVLEDALTSPNPAAVESALHGLGHIHYEHTARVVEVIAAYQQRGDFVSPHLRDYARSAGAGSIQ